MQTESFITEINENHAFEKRKQTNKNLTVTFWFIKYSKNISNSFTYLETWASSFPSELYLKSDCTLAVLFITTLCPAVLIQTSQFDFLCFGEDKEVWNLSLSNKHNDQQPVQCLNFCNF